jgi:hypothetical protein
MFNHLRIQPHVALALSVARVLVAHGTKRKRKHPGDRVERGLRNRNADHQIRPQPTSRPQCLALATILKIGAGYRRARLSALAGGGACGPRDGLGAAFKLVFGIDSASNFPSAARSGSIRGA